jgi:type I restriction enzyme M protein
MSSYLEKAINEGFISLDSDKKQITYTYQNIRRNYTNPEEQVQAEAFAKLILEYGYPVNRIRQYEGVTIGSSKREADIIVYNDDMCTQPYIIVECKNADISEQEFKQASEQAFSYAHALAVTTKFIWITKGNKEEFYRFEKDTNLKNTESDLPYFGETSTKKYKYAKGGKYKNFIERSERKDQQQR